MYVRQDKVCTEQKECWWVLNRLNMGQEIKWLECWEHFKMPELLGLQGLSSYSVALKYFKTKKQYLFEESSTYWPFPSNTRSKFLLGTASRLPKPLLLFGEQDLLASSFYATITRQKKGDFSLDKHTFSAKLKQNKAQWDHYPLCACSVNCN